MVPLALPTYIIAFVYADMCSYTGSLQKAYQWLGGEYLPFEIMSIGGAIFVMSLVLYPYVYMIARNAFLIQSQTLIEASQLLGKSNLYTFFKIALPLARPAIFGGLFLIMMDVLNEYGAVQYYGVSTFTTGIFRAWFSLDDETAAIRLSACLLLFVLVLILLEKWQRGRAKFADASKSSRPIRKYQLSKLQQVGAIMVCLFPLFFGFLLPIGQMLVWMTETASSVVNEKFIGWIGNSLFLGIVTALITVTVAVLLVYTVRLGQNKWMQRLSKVAVLGYAIPGAIIAVGILASFVRVDKFLIHWWESTTGNSIGLLLTGTAFSLVLAYMIRFLAIAFNPTEASFEKIASKLDEASRTLGASPTRTLFRINIPILRPTLLTAILMIFVEVMKELPLTLILRPFNFDTLATQAYVFASDEMIREASSPSLLVVLVGMIPVIALIGLMKKGN